MLGSVKINQTSIRKEFFKVTDRTKLSYDEWRDAHDTALAIGLNSYKSGETTMSVFDEKSFKASVKVKEKAMEDIVKIGEYVDKSELSDKSMRTVNFLLASREEIVFRINKQLTKYTLSLNTEQSNETDM